MTNLCALVVALLLVSKTTTIHAKSDVISKAGPVKDSGVRLLSGVGIIGGRNSTPGAWPWQLKFEVIRADKWYRHCGAILLSANYALTAAHCVKGLEPEDLRVVAGMYWPENYTDTQIVYIHSIKMHEKYQEKDEELGVLYKNDLAIVKFIKPVKKTKNVGFASLPRDSSQLFVGDTCTITGWGVMVNFSFIVPDVLQEANTTVISVAECQERMKGPFGKLGGKFNVTGGVWKNHICFITKNYKVNACNGDSGGPANCPSCSQYVAAGICSWGAVGCSPEYPVVYTRVSAYLDWIADNTPPVL